MEEVHLTERKRPNITQRKPPGRAMIPTEERLFVGRSEAAQMLSISCRALDYLIGKKQLNTRRIGSRVLIPMVAPAILPERPPGAPGRVILRPAPKTLPWNKKRYALQVYLQGVSLSYLT
jgi:hypothetical protein